MTRPKVPEDKRQRTAQACDTCKRRKQKVSCAVSLSPPFISPRPSYLVPPPSRRASRIIPPSLRRPAAGAASPSFLSHVSAFLNDNGRRSHHATTRLGQLLPPTNSKRVIDGGCHSTCADSHGRDASAPASNILCLWSSTPMAVACKHGVSVIINHLRPRGRNELRPWPAGTPRG